MRIMLGMLMLLVVGCAAETMGTVSGEVRFDGKVVESGGITFFSVDGTAQTTGGTITNGRYTCKVPVGKMKVVLTAPKQVGTKAVYEKKENSPMMPVTIEALPEKYNAKSELIFDVKLGQNEKNFELTK